MASHRSQAQRILDRLVLARGGEVSAVELSRISLQYSARLAELRAAGHVIRNRVETVNGCKRGFYWLETGAIATPAGATAPRPDSLYKPSLLSEGAEGANYSHDVKFYPD